MSKHEATEVRKEIEGEEFSSFDDGSKVKKYDEIPETGVYDFLKALQKQYEGKFDFTS